MAGYLRGILSKNKKLLEKFENIIKEDPEIWDKYQRTFNYMINFIHENGKRKKKLFDLNKKAFQRLKQCKKNRCGTISYNTLYWTLCPLFCIKKSEFKVTLEGF